MSTEVLKALSASSVFMVLTFISKFIDRSKVVDIKKWMSEPRTKTEGGRCKWCNKRDMSLTEEMTWLI